MVASVFTIGGRQRPPANESSESSASTDAAVRSAPSRSALLTTKMSAISMIPAFSACTSSPAPGTSITIEMSAVRTMSTSSWPTPTVSMRTMSLPAASRTSAASDDSARQSAEVAARRHAADEDAGVGDVRLHADAIAENRAAGERAGGIDGDDADGLLGAAELRNQAIDERALAGPRRAGDADQVSASGLREDAADEIRPLRGFVLDQADGARDRARIPLEDALGQ